MNLPAQAMYAKHGYEKICVLPAGVFNGITGIHLVLLEKYLERRKKEHRDYAPDAYKLLTDAKVERKGLLLAVISGKNAAAELSALLSGE